MVQIVTTAANDVRLWIAGAGAYLIALAIVAITGIGLAYMEYYYERRGQRKWQRR